MSLNQDAAAAQRGQTLRTVRIITDSPVLVQGKNSVKRKGRNKPVVFNIGGYTFTISLTDSGEPVVQIEPPPADIISS